MFKCKTSFYRYTSNPKKYVITGKLMEMCWFCLVDWRF